MDYALLTIYELKDLCRQKGIRGYGGKNKDALITLLGGKPAPILPPLPPSDDHLPALPTSDEESAAVESPIPESLPHPPPPSPNLPPLPPPPTDYFESSGPFTYIFERSAHLVPRQPKQMDGIWNLIEVVDTLRPRFLVLQNVKNLVRHNAGATYKEICHQLKERGYFHRYRIVYSLDKDHFYTVCLKAGESYETSYVHEKAEEARISILMKPTTNTKYFFEGDKWVSKLMERDYTMYNYIRKHVTIDHAEKQRPSLATSYDFSLRQCFDFTGFPLN